MDFAKSILLEFEISVMLLLKFKHMNQINILILGSILPISVRLLRLSKSNDTSKSSSIKGSYRIGATTGSFHKNSTN